MRVNTIVAVLIVLNALIQRRHGHEGDLSLGETLAYLKSIVKTSKPCMTQYGYAGWNLHVTGKTATILAMMVLISSVQIRRRSISLFPFIFVLHIDSINTTRPMLCILGTLTPPTSTTAIYCVVPHSASVIQDISVLHPFGWLLICARPNASCTYL